jgi:putative peptidoglycan lipid II flippase
MGDPASLPYVSPQFEGKGRSVAGAAGSVSAATMISRILAMFREMVMSAYFGAGLFTDAFNVAFRVPNMLRDLFAEGALSSAFVPTFIRTLTHEGRDRAWMLANRVINALIVILGLFTLLIFFGAKWFVYMLAAGYASIPQKMELTVQMTRIMSPFLLCVALAAVVMGMLNAFGSFFIPAMAPSAFNVCCILAGIFLSPIMPRFGLEPVVSMAVGALVGGASQFLAQLPAAYRMGYRYRPTIDFTDPALRHMAKLMLPAVIGLSATQINILVDSQLASSYGNGPVSWLGYAFRLMQLPIGLFGVAIATATLATVSHHAAHQASEKLQETVTSSLRLAACLTFPSTVGLIIFREEIIRLLYERGSFHASDTVQTGKVLFFYATALFAFSAIKIVVPTFYALNDTRTPVRISMVSVGVKVAINFLLVIPLGYLGLALATAIASWFSLMLLLHSLRRRLNQTLEWRDFAPYLRIALASACMGLLSLLAYRLSMSVFRGHGTMVLALNLAVGIAAGTGSVIPLLRLFGVEEIDELTRLVKRKLGLQK